MNALFPPPLREEQEKEARERDSDLGTRKCWWKKSRGRNTEQKNLLALENLTESEMFISVARIAGS